MARTKLQVSSRHRLGSTLIWKAPLADINVSIIINNLRTMRSRFDVGIRFVSDLWRTKSIVCSKSGFAIRQQPLQPCHIGCDTLYGRFIWHSDSQYHILQLFKWLCIAQLSIFKLHYPPRLVSYWVHWSDNNLLEQVKLSTY